jgi:hypothetical protein
MASILYGSGLRLIECLRLRRVIRFAIHSQLTCLSAAVIFERCRSFWGTPMSRPLRFIHTF